MRYLHSIANISIVVLSVLFFDCYGPLNFCQYNSRNCSTVECINEGLLDTTQADTTLHQKLYEEFLAGVDTTSRTTETIGKLLIEYLSKDDLRSVILLDTGKYHFQFFINPDGSSEISFLGKPEKIDTSAFKELNAALSQSVPHLPEVSGLWVFRGLSVNDANISIDSVNVYSRDKSGRSKESIMKVVRDYLKNLRVVYNRRLCSRPGISGKIIVKFAIDHHGRVFFSKVESSTMGDSLMESSVREQVSTWKFPPIAKKGDITEVVYPFIFSVN